MNIVEPGKNPEATISGSYGYAWQQLKKNFLYFIAVILMLAIAESPISGLSDSEFDITPITYLILILATAYMFLIFPVFKFGGAFIFLKGIRNEKMDVTDLFLGFRENYVSIILANLILFTLIGIGFLFLIIPGIILVVRLSFVSFLVMDKRMEPIAAIEKSWEMTRGNAWKIFGMFLVAIPVFIAGLLFCIVGVIVSISWTSAAFAAMYHAIDLEGQRNMT